MEDALAKNVQMSPGRLHLILLIQLVLLILLKLLIQPVLLKQPILLTLFQGGSRGWLLWLEPQSDFCGDKINDHCPWAHLGSKCASAI